MTSSTLVKSRGTGAVGFQETEFGNIPNDWVLQRIADVCVIFGRIGFRGYTVADIVGEGEGAISLSPSNIQDSRLNLDRCTYISWPKWKESPEIQISKGDILLVKTGSTVGKTAFVEGLPVEATVNPQVVVLKKSKISSRLLGYVLNHEIIQRQLVASTVGGALPTLSQKQIGEFRFPCPLTRHEQDAIAEALSDVDSLIESLEQLVAKKRAIKQGAMQDLLSGKRRLAGFNDAWPEKSFGEIFDFLTTATNPRSDLREDIGAYYVHYGDIHTRFHSHLNFKLQQPSRIDRSKCRNAALVKNGDWIMADASEDLDGVGKCVEIVGLHNDEQAVSGLHTFLLREKHPTFVEGFKGHLGNLKSLHQQYIRVMTGMKVFGVSKAALKNLMLPVPSEEEQLQITAILDEMENEIRELECKATKARYYKQGMMQDLLTGRVRLV